MTPPECELVENPRKDKTCRFSQEPAVREFAKLLLSRQILLQRFAAAVYDLEFRPKLDRFYIGLVEAARRYDKVTEVEKILRRIDGVRQTQYQFNVREAIAGILEACTERALSERCGVGMVKRCVHLTIDGRRLLPKCNIDLGVSSDGTFELHECKVKAADMICKSGKPKHQLQFLLGAKADLESIGRDCYSCVVSFRHSRHIRMNKHFSKYRALSVIGWDGLIPLKSFPPDPAVIS